MNGILNAVLDFLGLGNAPEPPDPNDPCNAPECIAAKQQLDAERRGYDSICRYLNIITVVTNILAVVVATPIWVLIVLLIIAVIFSGPIAVIIYGFLAIYVLSWVLLTMVIPQLTAAIGQALAEQQMVVAEAIRRVVENCPADCQGDISQPVCELPPPTT